MVSGAIQGPEGKDPFILYSLSLLKGSRAIKKTHGCDEFPWLSAAAGWDSRGDEWSGKQNEERRADWKENEEEKSRGESGIKESEEKTKGGSADCLLFSCRLRFLPCCHGRGFPALPSSLQPSDPILLPVGWGCCPFPSSAHSRTGTQLQGTTAEPVPQPRTQRGPRTNSKIQELQETSRQSVPVCLYTWPGISSAGGLYMHTYARAPYHSSLQLHLFTTNKTSFYSVLEVSSCGIRAPFRRWPSARLKVCQCS